jgi:hypothetical protein
MKTTLILLSFLTISPALASGWYCQEVASSWLEQGVTLQSCGIGYGSDENEARLDAFNNAKKEFENVCNKDTNCANNVVNIDPQRTSCDRKDDKVICHRLVNYHITKIKRQESSAPNPELKVIEIKTVVTETPTIINNTNHIVVHEHYNTYKNATFKGDEFKAYKTYVRTVNGVSIYETNSRSYQGIHLDNPSESEIASAVKRGSSSGGMPVIYIHRN